MSPANTTTSFWGIQLTKWNNSFQKFSFSSSGFHKWGAYTLKTFIKLFVVQDHLQYQHSFTVPFDFHHTVHPFLCYKHSTPSDLSLPPIQNSLYLLPWAPKNLQPLPLHLASWIHPTSTYLSANASTSSPALPVNKSTFQIPTRNPQPFRSLSALRSSWTQPSAKAEGYAAFWLGFPTSCLCRHVGSPTGWYPIIVLFPTIIFCILMAQGKITEVDTPTVQLGATPSKLISEPPPSSPPFLHQMPFLPQPSQFILAWDKHRNMLDCIPHGLVHIRCDQKLAQTGSTEAYGTLSLRQTSFLPTFSSTIKLK